MGSSIYREVTSEKHDCQWRMREGNGPIQYLREKEAEDSLNRWEDVLFLIRVKLEIIFKGDTEMCIESCDVSNIQNQSTVIRVDYLPSIDDQVKTWRLGTYNVGKCGNVFQYSENFTSYI